MCLDGLEQILNVGEANIGEVNDYYQLVEDAQGLEKIQNLRQHGSYKIYAKALKILEKRSSATTPPLRALFR